MQDSYLSSFTPSLMSPKTLEAIFVQREKLVEDLIAGVTESATTKNKHYRLLVGMRGIGKTHTIALLYHRLKNEADLQDKLLIAWLKEEEWGISSWLDLLVRIFRALEGFYPEEYRNKLAVDVETLYQISPEEATARGEIILKEFANQRTLLILTENLDEILKGLGDTGQKKFRAYLQNNSFITIVATTQSLSNDFKSRKRAFYGFFNTNNLDKLSLSEVTNLLIKIAQLQEDTKLETFIKSQTGQNRIEALDNLAKGNHRVYIIFSQFLTRDSLDDLVKPVMQTLDELTPYYQARMQWLSPQQRKIVELLCDRASAIPVKEIAQRCFISHQTASSQLKDLLTKGYVAKETHGRESFYDIQEPLMRICLNTKKQRGEPIKLFIDFLRIWYTQEELFKRYLSLSEEAKIEREYLIRAMGYSMTQQEFKVQIISAIEKRILHLGSVEINKILTIENNKDLDDTAYSHIGSVLYDSKRYHEALKAFNCAIEINPTDIKYWRQKAQTLFEIDRLEENLSVHEKILELDPCDVKAWNNKGVILEKLNNFEAALLAYERAINIEPNDIDTLANKGKVLCHMKRYKQGIEVFEQAIKYDSENYLLWHDKSFALLELGRLQEALESIDITINIKSDDVPSWIKKGMILHKMRNYDDALKAYQKAIDIDRSNIGILLLFLEDFTQKEKYSEALIYCNYLIKIEPDNSNWRFLEGATLHNLESYEQSLISLDKAINLNTDLADAFIVKAISLFKLNRWYKGFISIENGLSKIELTESFYEESIAEILKTIFEAQTTRENWQDRIKTLIKLHKKYKIVAILGKGITDNIPHLLSEMVSNKAARTWLEVWEEVGEDKPELEIALRFLKTAVEYKETKGDRKVLLQLPKEERDLFLTLLEDTEE